MSDYETVDLTPGQAVDWLDDELAAAARAGESADLNAALDAYARALGLALQLGPAQVEGVLRAVLETARGMAATGDADGLSALGPAVVGLVAQVEEAGALPATPVMDAWATVVSEIGALLGQLGLALGIPARHRAVMLEQALARAALLDKTTDSLFGLSAWLAGISSDTSAHE